MNKYTLLFLLMLLFLSVHSCTKTTPKVDVDICPDNEIVYVFPLKEKVHIEDLDCDFKIQGDIDDWLDKKFLRFSRHLTQERKDQIGMMIHNELKWVGIIDDHPDLPLLNGILDQMEFLIDAKEEYQLYILESKVVNAVTHIGRRIYLTKGLIDTLAMDAIVSCIGHELGHHLNGNCEEKARIFDMLDRNRIPIGSNPGVPKIIQSVLKETALKLYHDVNQVLSKSDEIEADLIGLYLCSALGYDPEIALEAVAEHKDWEHPPDRNVFQNIFKKFNSTHPDWHDRYDCAKAYVASAKIDISCDCSKGSKQGLVLKEEKVYQYPSHFAPNVGVLHKHQPMEVICTFANPNFQNTEYDEWCYIQYESGTGWVAEKYIRILE